MKNCRKNTLEKKMIFHMSDSSCYPQTIDIYKKIITKKTGKMVEKIFEKIINSKDLKYQETSYSMFYFVDFKYPKFTGEFLFKCFLNAYYQKTNGRYDIDFSLVPSKFKKLVEYAIEYGANHSQLDEINSDTLLKANSMFYPFIENFVNLSGEILELICSYRLYINKKYLNRPYDQHVINTDLFNLRSLNKQINDKIIDYANDNLIFKLSIPKKFNLSYLEHFFNRINNSIKYFKITNKQFCDYVDYITTNKKETIIFNKVTKLTIKYFTASNHIDLLSKMFPNVVTLIFTNAKFLSNNTDITKPINNYFKKIKNIYFNSCKLNNILFKYIKNLDICSFNYCKIRVTKFKVPLCGITNICFNGNYNISLFVFGEETRTVRFDNFHEMWVRLYLGNFNDHIFTKVYNSSSKYELTIPFHENLSYDCLSKLDLKDVWFIVAIPFKKKTVDSIELLHNIIIREQDHYFINERIQGHYPDFKKLKNIKKVIVENVISIVYSYEKIADLQNLEELHIYNFYDEELSCISINFIKMLKNLKVFVATKNTPIEPDVIVYMKKKNINFKSIDFTEIHGHQYYQQ